MQKIGQFITRVYIKDNYYIDFADSSARLDPEGSLIYAYGKRIHDPDMTGFGAFLARRQKLGEAFESGSIGRVLRDLFLAREIAETPPREPLVADFWLPNLQVMEPRSRPVPPQVFTWPRRAVITPRATIITMWVISSFMRTAARFLSMQEWEPTRPKRSARDVTKSGPCSPITTIFRR